MPAEDVTVTVTYTVNTHRLIINYLYRDDSVAAPQVNVVKDYNSTFDYTSPEVQGYHPNRTSVAGTMGDADTTINVYYDANTDTAYKVEYYKDNSTTAFKTIDYTGTTGSNVNATIIAVEGYELDRSNTNNRLSGKVLADGSLVLKVYYKKSMINYTVNVYYDGVLHSTNTYSAEFNSTINSSDYATTVSGYRTPTYTPETLTISATASNNIISIYYVKKAANISAVVSREITRNGKVVEDTDTEYGDVITFKITIKNTGDAEGTVNIKDLKLTEALDSTMTIDESQYTASELKVLKEFLSSTGSNITVNTNGEYVLTFDITITGNAGQSVSSQLTYTGEGEEAKQTTTLTLDIEKVITYTEISDNGANVVLVLDNSGSMKENGKLDAMKTAAKQFVNNILSSTQNPNNEVCVVVMPDDNNHTAEYKCSQTASTLVSYIDNNIDGSGWTPYTAALNGANGRVDYLKTTHSNNSNYVIFLTDGEPIDGQHQECTSGYWHNECKWVYDYDTNYTTVADTIKTKATMFTIGYEVDSTSKTRLESIASTGKYYAATTSNISTIFNELSAVIGSSTKRTEKGVMGISSNIDTTKNITIKVTPVSGTAYTLNKSFTELTTGTTKYIISDGNGGYELDAKVFNAGDKIELSYYLKAETVAAASFSKTMIFGAPVIDESSEVTNEEVTTEVTDETTTEITEEVTTDETTSEVINDSEVVNEIEEPIIDTFIPEVTIETEEEVIEEKQEEVVLKKEDETITEETLDVIE